MRWFDFDHFTVRLELHQELREIDFSAQMKALAQAITTRLHPAQRNIHQRGNLFAGQVESQISAQFVIAGAERRVFFPQSF